MLGCMLDFSPLQNCKMVYFQPVIECLTAVHVYPTPSGRCMIMFLRVWWVNTLSLSTYMKLWTFLLTYVCTLIMSSCITFIQVSSFL